MTTDHAELLSALMDREPVDPDALARALDDPAARQAVVAFAALRQRLHDPAPGEAEWLARQPLRPKVAAPRGSRWHLAAAAALLAAGVAVGVAAERYRDQQGPPQPTRIVQLEPLLSDRP